MFLLRVSRVAGFIANLLLTASLVVLSAPEYLSYVSTKLLESYPYAPEGTWGMMVLTDKGAVHCVCKDRFVVHHGTPRHTAAHRGTPRRVAAHRGTPRRVAARGSRSRAWASVL